ncbi:MAG: TlpA family protein disulfide reductase [Bacteroidales bacterium]|nr:TlpA family protein disulfide reductase [Bacteroidales bacterium]
MNLLRTILVSILIFSTAHINAQEATVQGNAPDYKGDEIVFYQHSDFITMAENEIGRCKVDSSGEFTCTLKILETTYVYSYLGIYRIYFFAEPSKKYSIVLPKKEVKTEAQRLNPFFRETDLQVGITNITKDDINYLINSFDLRFNENFDQIVINAYKGKRQTNLDSLINNLECNYTNSQSQYFNAYREYRYGLLKQITFYKKSTSVSNELFLNKPILYGNPAYMELFNLVYDKYFLFFSRTTSGNVIFKNISADRSISKLKETLAGNKILSNDTLMEMVILKGLYDEFFSDNFSRSALLTLLDSVYRTTKIPEHILIAENIRSKITKLLPGFVPNAFTLNDADGNPVSLNKFEGKYVYLNFCTTTSYSCLQEFPLLDKLYKKYGEHLEIVSVSADNDLNDLKSYLKSSGYKWTFLHYGNKPDIIKDFDIRAYPTYFLIGPDKRLIYSPAPSPRENFEMRFFQLLRDRGEI